MDFISHEWISQIKMCPDYKCKPKLHFLKGLWSLGFRSGASASLFFPLLKSFFYVCWTWGGNHWHLQIKWWFLQALPAQAFIRQVPWFPVALHQHHCETSSLGYCVLHALWLEAFLRNPIGSELRFSEWYSRCSFSQGRRVEWMMFRLLSSSSTAAAPETLDHWRLMCTCHYHWNHHPCFQEGNETFLWLWSHYKLHVLFICLLY